MNEKGNKLKRIVCLGGGIGTSNLLRGLKNYPVHLSIVTSMADDGGSSGRLRQAYGIMPPGDIISCIAALISDENKELADLLTYRLKVLTKKIRLLVAKNSAIYSCLLRSNG